MLVCFSTENFAVIKILLSAWFEKTNTLTNSWLDHRLLFWTLTDESSLMTIAASTLVEVAKRVPLTNGQHLVESRCFFVRLVGVWVTVMVGYVGVGKQSTDGSERLLSCICFLRIRTKDSQTIE